MRIILLTWGGGLKIPCDVAYILFMRPIFLSFAIIFAATASMADEESDAPSLMERGAQLFMEGFLKELEPTLEGLDQLGPQLRGFAQEMGPALVDLFEQVKDWSLYHPPEILPNGDIIIRRKDPKPEDDGAIDL